MADFGGFQITTPQELQAQQMAQRQKLFGGGVPISAQRQGNIELALDGIFGNPQMRQANRAQQALKTAAQSTASPQDGESQLDFEMRRLTKMRDALTDISPDTANQINERLLQLGEMKFQRQRLTAADQRTQESHDLEIDKGKDEQQMRHLLGGNTYIYDPESGTAQSFDLRDPSQAQDFIKARQDQSKILMSPAQVYDLYHDVTIEKMKIREALARADTGGSKVEEQRAEQASSGMLGLLSTTDRIFQVLDTNPDVLTVGSKGAAKLDQLAQNLGSVARAANGGKTSDGTNIDSWLAENNITNARAAGLVVGVAYELAKTRDSSGRISDKDLDASLKSIGSNNPDPRVLVANLNDIIQSNSQALMDRMNTLSPATREAMKDRTTLLRKRLDEFQTKFTRYTKGNRGPAAMGATGAKNPAEMSVDEILAQPEVKGQ